ncbi:MAG: hypothetical protein ACRDA8_10540, partial [Shewanella sp.]
MSYGSLSPWAYGAPSPVALLAEQCLRLPSIQLASAFASEQTANAPDAANTVSRAAMAAEQSEQALLALKRRAILLERETLGLNNIHDRLNYYRSFELSELERQGLLQCQLRLSDMLGQLVTQAEFIKLAEDLHQGDGELMLLGAQLTRLRETHLPKDAKAKLHMAQASIRQGLAAQEVNLNFAQGKCQLPSAPSAVEGSHEALKPALNSPSADDKTEPHAHKLTTTIAQYLLKQEDSDCRRQVWQAYQSRAKSRSQLALSTIVALRQASAQAAGFKDFSQWSLQRHYLASSELVHVFLESQTQSIAVAPWDLGRQLAMLPAANGPARSTVEVLVESIDYLKALGLSFELLDGAPLISSTPNAPYASAPHAANTATTALSTSAASIDGHST